MYWKVSYRDHPYSTKILDKPWYFSVSHTKYPRFQNVMDCAYWPVLGKYNKYNTINFTNKTTPKEDFYEIHKVVLDYIRENMASLVHTGEYDVISTIDPTTIGYYVVKFLSKPVIL